MKRNALQGPDFRLGEILLHFQPSSGPHYSAGGRLVTLVATPRGKKRNKEREAYNAERDWRRNLAFVSGLYTLIPADNSVLKMETEKLLLAMFGKGFAYRLARFNTAERKRIKKHGDAAWRLVKKLRKHYGLPELKIAVFKT
jgi:hypothetical protein